ncbi:YbaB/EbfC family nucleoid-associated protein [Micromonospora sp. RTP1Z1]|uniref:YbaB/EbfC family nucleoid-associated protein n=1 Tax=Micromonospora sp. RTP1Z1 TaxID=2994043 RepID=UPI0029C90AEC|nr:YbaB/EbfC family nucleoid-associated protein [Micromonospora sp. RTP1Z1]
MTNEPFTAAATLDEFLTRTQQALSVMRSRPAAHADDDADELLRADGTAADGLVRAVVVQGGRLESVTVDPGLSAQGIEAVCAHIVVAVNAALADLEAQVSASAQADVDALAARLGGLQEQSRRQVELFSQAMESAAARLGGGRTG